MVNENATLTEADARHLLRRAGFSATRKELTKSGLVGLKRGPAADKLLGYKPRGFRPSGSDQRRQHDSLMRYLLTSRYPVQEKLTLFWHDHFSTGISKLFAGNFDLAIKIMGNQNKLLRLSAKGNMKDFVKAVSKDPAMMEFLDTVRNEKSIPNENYARELLELFTLGVFDSQENENYTQADIVQIARAFTGWDYSRSGKAFFNSDNHDYNADFEAERGEKRIFTTKGQISGGARFDVNGEGAPEMDAVIDILFTHRDSDGANTIARRTARRLLEFYVGPTPSLALIDDVVSHSSFDTTFSIQALVRSIFCSDEFFATGLPFGPGVTKSVKWPVDFMIGSMRLLAMKFVGNYKYIPGGTYTGELTHLENMGQVLLDPPSVFGWDWETSWLSSSTLLARYNFARDIVAARGTARFRPDKLVDLDTTDPESVVDQVLDALDVGHNFTQDDKDACVYYLTHSIDMQGDPPVPVTIPVAMDLSDDNYVETKLHGLFELVMKSPGYQVF